MLYLVRHADAKKGEDDPAKPLSEIGLQNIGKVASYALRLNIKLSQIFHSNVLRAKQTAEILGEMLAPAKGVSETDGLSPLDDPQIWAARLKGLNDAILLVGHLPHLDNLASLLLCGHTERSFVSFKTAGMACLKREDDLWTLQSLIAPEILV